MAPEAELEVEKVMFVLMKYLTPELSISAWEPVAFWEAPRRAWSGFALAGKSWASDLRSTRETSAEAAVAVSRASVRDASSLWVIRVVLLPCTARLECERDSSRLRDKKI